MKAQDNKVQDVLINEQFDKLILNDQKRKAVTVTGIPSDATFFQCSDPFIKYTRDLGAWFQKYMLESTHYTEASKIQFIKDALADTSDMEDQGDPTNKFTLPCNYWRSSKEATALMYAAFDNQLQESNESEMSEESKKWTELDIRFRRLQFVIESQLPESYQMITDYIKDRPGFMYKWLDEPELAYWLVQLGKEKEAFDFLEVIIEDIIHDGFFRPRFGYNYGIFNQSNLFYFLCLSENEAVAKRATDLLFHLLSKKDYDAAYYLQPLAAHIDKARYDQLDVFKKVKRTADIMPEETMNELIADLNNLAVKCGLPAIRLNKLSKFLISMDKPTSVIYQFLYANNFIVSFQRLISLPDMYKGEPIDYVTLFNNKFSQVVNAQHCNHFTIGQVTQPGNNNEYNYNLFVKYNQSGYHLSYNERGTHVYTDIQRLVKMLNLCLGENKEKKRFFGWYSDMILEFVLIEPAAFMPLVKKYNLKYFAIEEGDLNPKTQN